MPATWSILGKIVFINPPYVKNDTAGNRRSGVSPTDGQYYDPLGNTLQRQNQRQLRQFNCQTLYCQHGRRATNAKYRRNRVVTREADRSTGHKNFSASDDVISWQ